MSIAKMLELAQKVKPEPYGLHTNVLRELFGTYQHAKYHEDYIDQSAAQARISHRRIFSHTWQHGDYGTQIEIMYLDDLPISLLDYGCGGSNKYMEDVEAYVISKENLNALEEFIKTIYRIPPGQEHKIEMLTDELAATMQHGSLVLETDEYPINIYKG